MDPRYHRQRYEGLLTAAIGIALVVIIGAVLGSLYTECMQAIMASIP